MNKTKENEKNHCSVKHHELRPRAKVKQIRYMDGLDQGKLNSTGVRPEARIEKKYSSY